MDLKKMVEKRLKEVAKDEAKKAHAIRRAEELADLYEYVKPKNDVPTADRFYGLPAFQNEKIA